MQKIFNLNPFSPVNLNYFSIECDWGTSRPPTRNFFPYSTSQLVFQFALVTTAKKSVDRTYERPFDEQHTAFWLLLYRYVRSDTYAPVYYYREMSRLLRYFRSIMSDHERPGQRHWQAWLAASIVLPSISRYYGIDKSGHISSAGKDANQYLTQE
jgi:hypothetical protein